MTVPFTFADASQSIPLAELDANFAAVGSADNIEYNPPFANSTVETVTAKLAQIVSVKDFGAVGDGITNDTTAINNALATGSRVYFPAGTYLANVVSLQPTFDVYGDGMDRTIIKPYSTSLPAFKNMSNPGSANFWRRSSISKISLQSSGNVGNGFTFGDPAVYTAGDEQIGRVDFTEVEILGFNKGIFKTCGNIGNNFYSCRFASNNYNYYAQSSDFASGSAPAMHSGFDAFYGGENGYATLAAIFVRDNIIGKGGWTFRDVDIEGNTGYAVVGLANSSFDYGPDMTFDCCWFEDNATGGSITIDGLSGSITGNPYWMYISGIKHLTAKEVYLGTLNFFNGVNFIAEKCYADTVTPIFSLTMDASCTFVNDGVASNTGFLNQMTLAPYASDNWSSSTVTTSAYNVIPGASIGYVNDWVVRAGYSGQSLITSSNGIVPDGLTFDSCNQFVVSSSVTTSISGITTTAGNWYAVSLQVRLVSGSQANAYVGNLSSASGILINSSEWRQINFVRKATQTNSYLAFNSLGSSSTINVGAFQVVEFNTAADAYNYLYKGRLATNNDAKSIGPQMSAFTAAGGGYASFNTSSISCQLSTAGYYEILQSKFGSIGGKVQLDMMLSGEDFYTGNSQSQPVGFTSVTFSSVSDSSETFTIGAATVTLKWVAVSGYLYSLQGKITSGSSTVLNLAGIAFVKGK